MKIRNQQEKPQAEATVLLVHNESEFSEKMSPYIKKFADKGNNTAIVIPAENTSTIIALLVEKGKTPQQGLEKARVLGHETLQKLNQEMISSAEIVSDFDDDTTLAFVEGMLLSDYSFKKYKTKDNKPAVFQEVYTKLPQDRVEELVKINEAVTATRNLVNEPVSTLDAVQFSKEIRELGKKYGFSVEVLGKKQIETLKMGGLLGVNKGSEVPPTFNILTWKPKDAVNEKPYVFVGKGVVYDTGGYNVKVANYMDNMKADMGGGAAVIGTLCAVAQNNLPLYVVGLIPATDNRINSNAIVSDDILTMMNGLTVEVKNTDAEGRLILADGLAYAQKYNPELVIDLATLTGAAARVTAHYGSAMMGNASNEVKQALQKSGEEVYERLVEFPFWEEFEDDIKSPIADIKNLGNPEGGATTAGKFLEHFTDYPWIHLDIAGPAFITKTYRYFKPGATGVGVRLLYNFLKSKV